MARQGQCSIVLFTVFSKYGSQLNVRSFPQHGNELGAKSHLAPISPSDGCACKMLSGDREPLKPLPLKLR